MTSWTNATADPEPGSGRAWARPPEPEPRADEPASVRSGLGNLVHPQRLTPVLQRNLLPIITPALRPYTDYHWMLRWARQDGPPLTSEVITDPVCHLTFEQGRNPDGTPLVRHGVVTPAAVVTSVWTDRFRVELDGIGRVFGVRFRPGGLAGLIGRPVASAGSVPAVDLLPGADTVLAEVLAEPDDDRRRTTVERWLAGLAELAGEPDPDFLHAADLVERVRRDLRVVRVEQIGEQAGLSVRGVQRLFRFYIGVPPKWVLMRCRLKDAAAALDADPAVDQADLAVRLGWYDQPHFVRDFRRFLGVTPGRYAADAADTATDAGQPAADARQPTTPDE